MAEARAIQRELGLMIEYWSIAQLSARIAQMAGDLDLAADELREACEQLQAVGETAFLSTTAAQLAEIELLRDEPASARRWLEVAERSAAAGDRSSQIGIELVRGQLLARDADDGYEDHLRAALTLVDGTDSPLWRSDTRLGIARTLAHRRPEEAAVLLREARELSEAKGLLVYVDEADHLLAELNRPA